MVQNPEISSSTSTVPVGAGPSPAIETAYVTGPVVLGSGDGTSVICTPGRTRPVHVPERLPYTKVPEPVISDPLWVSVPIAVPSVPDVVEKLTWLHCR